jgi:hypothetical protein
MDNQDIGSTAGESSPQNKRAYSEREHLRSTRALAETDFFAAKSSMASCARHLTARRLSAPLV